MPEDLSVIELMRDDLHMVVRDSHPLLSKRRLKLGDLAHVQWILPGP